ncbi:MAG TPA: CRTAC1 family protein [Steroidobacteraceae bacterium]|nr:CRTAC1 family protein [Steroidobacteraceae bacterium]
MEVTAVQQCRPLHTPGPGPVAGGLPRRARAHLAGAALVALACAPAAEAQIAFADASQSSGVDRAGESYGASWGDLNGDGYPDLFVSNHREQPSLYLNRPAANGRFFYETADQVLPFRNRPHADTHGASWADIDNDGDQDLLVSTGRGNISQLLINERQRMVDRTTAWGLTATDDGGRLPVWLDYNGDKLLDFVMTQYAGIARLYRQGPPGTFTNTTGAAKLVCEPLHYAHLIDVNNDERLDFLCPKEETFPQRIYDTQSMPWCKIGDIACPAPYMPIVGQTVDSVVADFNNDRRPDIFVLGGSQLRPSGVAQLGSYHFEAQLAGGIKGFKFVTSGKVRFDIDWNRQAEVSGAELQRIEIGAGGYHPTNMPFTLDPAKAEVRGMPPKPTETDIPVMQIWYDAVAKRWTVIVWTQLTATGQKSFSEAYFSVDSIESTAISNLEATGRWPSDRPAKPTLLTNYSGGWVDETARANLDVPIQCVSATAGDFDNDMDVDLYLACREAARNIPNILYENLGGGIFRKVTDAGGAAGPVGLAVRENKGTADSVVTADYDLDGFLDLFVTNGFNLRPKGFGGSNKLFRNRGNGKRWVQVELVGVQSDRDATGARIYATANGVQQMRVLNGSYHRWSQDQKRVHFGLAGATTVNLRVVWPDGTSKNWDVATNRFYRIRQGDPSPTSVAKGWPAPAYQCGPPPLNGAIDKGIFIWRDCPSGEWRLKAAAAGGQVTYAGSVTSAQAFVRVTRMGLESGDSVDTSNSQLIKFTFDTRGTGTDGFNFLPKDGVSACLRITAPSGLSVYYGPFRASRPAGSAGLNLDTREPC